MGGTVVPRPLNTVSAIMACLYLPNKIHQSATLFAKCNCQNHKIDLSKSKKKKTVKFIQCSYEVYSSKSRWQDLLTLHKQLSWLPPGCQRRQRIHGKFQSWEIQLRNTIAGPLSTAGLSCPGPGCQTGFAGVPLEAAIWRKARSLSTSPGPTMTHSPEYIFANIYIWRSIFVKISFQLYLHGNISLQVYRVVFLTAPP